MSGPSSSSCILAEQQSHSCLPPAQAPWTGAQRMQPCTGFWHPEVEATQKTKLLQIKQRRFWFHPPPPILPAWKQDFFLYSKAPFHIHAFSKLLWFDAVNTPSAHRISELKPQTTNWHPIQGAFPLHLFGCCEIVSGTVGGTAPSILKKPPLKIRLLWAASPQAKAALRKTISSPVPSFGPWHSLEVQQTYSELIWELCKRLPPNTTWQLICLLLKFASGVLEIN